MLTLSRRVFPVKTANKFCIVNFFCTFVLNNTQMNKKKTVKDAMQMRPKDLAKMTGHSIHAIYKWRTLYKSGELSDWRKHKIEFLIN